MSRRRVRTSALYRVCKRVSECDSDRKDYRYEEGLSPVDSKGRHTLTAFNVQRVSKLKSRRYGRVQLALFLMLNECHFVQLQ